ncbi:hypothetical protein [Leptolyngbya ohadii]|uniref:hypothetical protein n=1 Tax=Leptolyngbya ohadii TaxID=1962290 RepID=UPI000B59C2C4|nr:hypothetical protein [Leptolyngbya ohadii]
MLNVLQQIAEIDDRYANDQELTELEQVSQHMVERLRLYQKLSQGEEQILAELYKRLSTTHSQLFILNGKDVSAQCRNEVQYTLHQAIQSLLLGEDWLQESFLLWMQTIIRSLKLQSVCNVVYSTLETLLQSALTPQESQIICPVIQQIKESLTQP